LADIFSNMNILFYTTRIEAGFAYIEEEETRHLTTVLRRKAGDPIDLTDGKGRYFAATIAEITKKGAIARVNTEKYTPPSSAKLHLAVAPTKNIERFEWLLEKAVEIGVDTITPLLCRHSERTVVRQDRLEKIVVSAMKQCLRTWLPVLNPMTPFKKVVTTPDVAQRFIGWCPPESEMPHLKTVLQPGRDTVIFIGPEGDFSPEEITLAQENGCVPITLGAARLRTETAGIFACSVFNLVQV
jgi:16S rRNA (uracil1498-N3)-methyltransferase